MSKHTPGPWEARTGEACFVHRPAMADFPIFIPGTRDEGAADARLIAAAPDLLEALKAVLTETSAPATHIAFRQLREQVLAAIAKAEGVTRMNDTERADLRIFLNRLKILRSLGLIEVLDVHDWPKFRDDPAEYLIRCDDEEGEHIWTALRAREPKRYI